MVGSDVSAAIPQGGGRDSIVALEALKARAGGRDLGPTGRALAPVMQGTSFNLGDEAVAAGVGAIKAAKGGDFKDEYELAKEIQKQELAREHTENPKRAIAGEIGGGLTSGLGIFKAGLTAARFIPTTLQGAGRFGAGVGAGATDAAAIGGLAGFGAGDGAQDRAEKALAGGTLGGALGASIPVAGKAAGAVLSPIISPLWSRLAPEGFANTKLLQTFRRAKMTPEEAAAELDAAKGDSQGVYTMADALGNAGQRAVSGVARIPHNERQALIDFLDQRQAGQGRRISNSLAEGFDAPDTAAQRVTSLTKTRKADAETNYGQARKDASMVDVSPAIAKADEFLSPGVTSLARPSTGIADNSIESAVRRARSYLTDGKSQVSDFQSAFLAKQELDNIIESASPSQQRVLIPIRDALDDQLAKSSKPYANARDTYRAQSNAIDAVPDGTTAAMRGRTEDTIPAFRGMSPPEQSAFRAGYVDPLIADTQRAAIGVNKARPLINDATAAEFPAFAAPGQADRLGRRLTREQQMFETRNAANGGSKTADNLADSADVTTADPAVLANLLSGNLIQAGKAAGSRLMSEAGGMSPSVAERLAKMLMERDAPAVLRNADTARRSLHEGDMSRQALLRMLLGGTLAPAAQ